MTIAVLCNGSKTEPFRFEIGVRQGCIIAPTLFTVFVVAVLHITGHSLSIGVQTTYRIDDKLFNLNSFRAKSKIFYTSNMELQYADDNAIVAHT